MGVQGGGSYTRTVLPGLRELVGWGPHCPSSCSLQWGDTTGHKDAPSSVASPAWSLGLWGHVGHPWGLCYHSLTLSGSATSLSALSDQPDVQVCGVALEFPIPWLLGQSEAGCPPCHPGLHAASPAFHRQAPPSKVRDRSLLCVSPGWATCHAAPASQIILTTSRTPRWPRCCSSHRSQDTRAMVPACSRCHQLNPVHLSGAGLSHTAPAQPCAGKLTRASTSSSPHSQPLPRLYKRQHG